MILEGMARHAGQLLAWAWDTKRAFNALFLGPLCIFWCSVVTLVTFSWNLNNFERILKKSKNSKTNKKYQKKNFKKTKKN